MINLSLHSREVAMTIYRQSYCVDGEKEKTVTQFISVLGLSEVEAYALFNLIQEADDSTIGVEPSTDV